ncbi:DNA-binding response regulator, NarL/FixJ family, contains REC and HTH domains [Oceanicella actignis]|uniref:DNA-binding response regulator, NarL/FixJ family, contains REC and HTH domains n=1 Tax=Oceanicella actignis TaxID=1189325 RepID=A0A1M7U0U3_9RHOB|nr:LuxR family two component transcriptional regulator [Oceanicella actignis]SET85713.1 two component transcriptional regulator, LuxR family [Oceanicella actignis]SHN76641.1 DNA-binding response regulator, NarL/FixJ family, contains REC and HTH domains [Oceanicella actignis]
MIDDHPLFCEALAMTLTGALGARQVDCAASLGDALARLAAGPAPGTALLDLNLPDVEGVDGLIRLRAAAPGMTVVVVSSLSDARVVEAALRAGAAGFIPKDTPREALVGAMRAIWAGQVWAPGEAAEARAAEAADPGRDEALARMAELTPQQLRILGLVCEGKLNKQIAYDLGIAETTVKAHISAILRKLKVQSRTQAVLIAQKARFDAILRQDAGPD